MNNTLLALLLGVFSMIMWLIESYDFIKFLKERLIKFKQEEQTLLNKANFNIDILLNTPKLLPFVFDLTITLSLISMFGVGGTVGAVLGLGISNAFSIFILLFMAVVKYGTR